MLPECSELNANRQVIFITMRHTNVYRTGQKNKKHYVNEKYGGSAVEDSAHEDTLVAHVNHAVPRTRIVRKGPWSFAVSVEFCSRTLWKSLPVELRTMHIPLETFKRKLKIYLFTMAYDQ